MKIYITTYPKMAHLADTALALIKKFWKDHPDVVIVNSDCPYADGLIAMLEDMREEHFILMHEDMFLLEPVDTKLFKKVEKYVVDKGVDRFGLQCITDGYENAVTPEGEFFTLDPSHQYLCSFEASIFSRRFLLKHLKPGEGPHATEINASKRARGANVKLTKTRVLTYKDAVIHGEERIFFHNDELFLKTGDDTWTNTHVTV